jgi:hypothetical protein
VWDCPDAVLANDEQASGSGDRIAPENAGAVCNVVS